jgi:flavin reductase (DIM6/NTAB) family NADH-FMN oxidoreductase RutF
MAKREIDPSVAPRLLEPGPTALLTSFYRGQPNVMTLSWSMSVGFDPPRIAVAVHPDRLTHEFASRTETFGLSIPLMDHLLAVHRCGIESGRDHDKWQTAELTPMDPVEIEAPHVEECVAHLECGVVDRLTVADHDLFIADVIAAQADDALFTDRWLTSEELPLIIHLAADYYASLTRGYQAILEEESDSEASSQLR